MSVCFEPVCFDHAAALIQKTPWEVSRDVALLADAHLAAIRRYGLRSCVVGMDIYNLEAEAYGAEVLKPSGSGMPTVAEATLQEVAELRDLQMDPAAGRIPLLLEAANRVAATEPTLPVFVPLSGPFTIATQMLGLENLVCEAMTEPAEVAAALNHLAGEEISLIRRVRAAGFGIAVYESAVAPPLLSPELFRNLVAPALSALLEQAEGATQLIIGGHTLPILAELFSLPAAYRICPAETDQISFLHAVPRNCPGILRVNMNPSVFLHGRQKEARQELNRVRKLCATRPDLDLRCGSLIPYEADPEIVLACCQRR